jgi:hypothetical protein
MSFDWTNGKNNVITGKMIKDANTAYRASLRLNFGSTTNEQVDVDATPFGGPASIDSIEVKNGGSNINLGAGIQMYRGKGRLRGYYGGEANIGISSSKTTWSGSDFVIGTGANAISAEVKGGSFNFGVRGFIGAEYFFAPKMSLSGEFGWGLNISSTKGTETSYTYGSNPAVNGTGGKTSSFGLDTDNAGAAINLNFYF